MNKDPLVTVNILSFNRKDELRNTLTKVYEQDYKNIEVIVVDNASSDGSAEMVKKEFPDVHLIQMEKNIGIAGWNEGFKVAKGEYVLVLDDDSYPDKQTIYNSLLCAQEKDNIGIIVLRIFDNKKDSIINEKNENQNTLSFIGCGALISNKALRRTNYFNEKLFLYEHEVDFAIRIYNDGLKLVYCNHSLIIHSNSVINRKYIQSIDHRKVFYSTKNILFILLNYFEYKKVLFRILRICIGRLFLAIPNYCFVTVCKGIYAGFKLSFENKNKRKVVRSEIQKLYSYGSFAGGFFGQRGMLN